ncbi:MAG: ribonuclease H-like domain-containing protein [Candidatus Aenigmarchaeota archaeon]|nr:ribonuclease H-like domain-containing protein [Candidatus Aenigmarchaeota archaeon]
MIVRFQLLDADYFLRDNKPVLRLFGRTAEGKAVCVLYDKFQPYFYVRCSEPQKLKGISAVRIEEVEKFPAVGYSGKMLLYKITITNPQDVPKMKDQLLSGKLVEEVYEADILFKYRFMVDFGIFGMGWAEAEAERVNTAVSKITSFRAESIKPIDKIENVALNYLAFDIECVPSDPRKPLDSKKDPIVMISCSFYPDFRGKRNVVLVARPFFGEGIQGFSTEKEMLEEFLKIIESYDPDIITGYNINGFDFPYLVERLKQNKLPQNLGRTDKTTFSRTFGMTNEFVLTGRAVADPYQILKKDPWVKFHRYDLNTVAKIMLNEKKHDIEYGEMSGLWNGNRDGLARFIEYCRRDSDLSMRLVIDKGMLDKFVELAKISGLLLQDVMGGQTRRIDTMILHEFKKRGFVMPLSPSKSEMIRRTKEREKSELKGAIVLEPKKGLHAEGCVLVLDFKSLYPSIMRTYNVSPDTLTTPQDPQGHQSPSGAFFVDASVREGLLPIILTRVLAARNETKKKMKTAKGEEKRILNAKQLALKDISNSFYGFTGYIRARLYTFDVASTITAYGRKNLEKTRKLIEENFGVDVIYADTDSAFIKTSITNLDEAKQLGEKISKFVTEQLPGHLELEFEKIYRTFLILTKKRYAGWKFEKSDDSWHDELQMKGIETVRRDWCPLASELMLDVLNTVLKEGDIAKAMELVKNTIADLRAGKIPLEKLTIIKGITKSIESYEGTLPHIELARKLAKRNPQDPPKVGDRLGFVIIKGDQMLSKRAEDPQYVEQNKLQLDSDYYIQSQIFPPVERIFAALGIQKTEILGSGRQTSLGDIMSGAKRSMKHTIVIDKKPLEGWEEFVCKKCKRSYRRMPLSGICECGGEMLIGFRGSTGDKVAVR